MVYVNAATFTGHFVLIAMSKKSLVIYFVPRNRSGISQRKRIPHSAPIQGRPTVAMYSNAKNNRSITCLRILSGVIQVSKTQQSNFTLNSDFKTTSLAQMSAVA